MNESKILSNDVVNNEQTIEPSWDKAISDASAEIERLLRQARRLRQAKMIFEINKKDGVPWPRSAENGATSSTSSEDLS
jgi:hypothetical protein